MPNMYITATAQCPEATPFAVARGHFCCLNPEDPGTGNCRTITPEDHIPCRQPPCKTATAARLAPDTQVCPPSHSDGIHGGRYCCKTSLSDSDCEESVKHLDMPRICCQGGHFVHCTAKTCTDFPVPGKFKKCLTQETKA